VQWFLFTHEHPNVAIGVKTIIHVRAVQYSLYSMKPLEITVLVIIGHVIERTEVLSSLDTVLNIIL
jgi:hypothetical protein